MAKVKAARKKKKKYLPKHGRGKHGAASVSYTHLTLPTSDLV